MCNVRKDLDNTNLNLLNLNDNIAGAHYMFPQQTTTHYQMLQQNTSKRRIMETVLDSATTVLGNVCKDTSTTLLDTSFNPTLSSTYNNGDMLLGNCDLRNYTQNINWMINNNDTVCDKMYQENEVIS